MISKIDFSKLDLPHINNRKIFVECINDEICIRDKLRPSPAIVKRSVFKNDWVLDCGAAGISEDDVRFLFCRTHAVDIFIDKELKKNVID
jgi:hypothetical protein